MALGLERRHTRNELVREDAQGPDIGGAVVLSPLPQKKRKPNESQSTTRLMKARPSPAQCTLEVFTDASRQQQCAYSPVAAVRSCSLATTAV